MSEIYDVNVDGRVYCVEVVFLGMLMSVIFVSGF